MILLWRYPLIYPILMQAKGYNYGFVEYDDPGAAERAMQTLNGRRVHQSVRNPPPSEQEARRHKRREEKRGEGNEGREERGEEDREKRE